MSCNFFILSKLLSLVDLRCSTIGFNGDNVATKQKK